MAVQVQVGLKLHNRDWIKMNETIATLTEI